MAPTPPTDLSPWPRKAALAIELHGHVELTLRSDLAELSASAAPSPRSMPPGGLDVYDVEVEVHELRPAAANLSCLALVLTGALLLAGERARARCRDATGFDEQPTGALQLGGGLLRDEGQLALRVAPRSAIVCASTCAEVRSMALPHAAAARNRWRSKAR